MNKKLIKSVFRKNIYLLGEDSNDINYWLESPSFDCDWHWGFGYVETYINNSNPKLSKDISSHSHIDSGKYLTSNILVETSYSNDERLILIDLFDKFYGLSEKADSLHKNNTSEWFKLNSIDIPNVMNKIIELLTPKSSELIVYKLPDNIKAE